MFSLRGRVPMLGTAGTGRSTIPFQSPVTEMGAVSPAVRHHGT